MLTLPSLVAIDLDGTLLSTDKKLSPANRSALVDMHSRGVVVLLASGRIGSSMLPYADQLPFEVSMLTLNGAAVYAGRCDTGRLVYEAFLPVPFADELLDFSADKTFALNYYSDGRLFSVEDAALRSWLDLYVAQTGSRYEYVDSYHALRGGEPSKCLMVGDPRELDVLERDFRSRWGNDVYIVRTWDYYLEFMNLKATKGLGIAAFARHQGIDMSRSVGFGDADNDVPLLETCALGIAPRGASHGATAAADVVSIYGNDEDFIAREWENLLRRLSL